jgi:hypothetical protein
MALTAEQQAQLELETALENARTEARMLERGKDQKLEALRIAQAVILENYRNADAGAADMTAEQITAFATTLVTYVNSDG